MKAEIKGSILPILECELAPGDVLVSHHGELAWMSPGIGMTQTTSAGGSGGFMKGLKRAVGGGGVFLTEFSAPQGGFITFATRLPGTIMPVEISPAKGYTVHRSGWICGTQGITPTVAFQKTLGAGIFGGEGFVLQRLEGQGQAWIELSGEVTDYQLAPGQTLLVHPGHIGMFEDSVQFTMTTVPGIKNKLFGGAGFFLVQLTGPGQVWLQSLTLPGLADALEPYLPQQNASNAGKTGVVGGIIGGVLGGDR
jgi:uncharacterized protein (TIGR00266 family)